MNPYMYIYKKKKNRIQYRKSIIRNQNLELQKNIYIALLVHWLRCTSCRPYHFVQHGDEARVGPASKNQ